MASFVIGLPRFLSGDTLESIGGKPFRPDVLFRHSWETFLTVAAPVALLKMTECLEPQNLHPILFDERGYS